MNREQMRSQILDEIARVTNSIAMRFIHGTDAKVLHASEKFWREDAPATNAALDRLCEVFNAL